MAIRDDLIKLGSTNPELRPHIRPLLRVAMEFDTPDALKKYLRDHPDADKSKHTVKEQKQRQEKQVDDRQYDGMMDYLVNGLEHAETVADGVDYLTKEFGLDSKFANDLIKEAFSKASLNDDVASGLIDSVSRRHGYSER
jgi:hypothetical protein